MELLRSRQDEPAAKPASSRRDRRRQVRHQAHFPAWASANAGPGSTALNLNEILDVSEDGMSFRATSQIPVGRRLKLCLDLPEAASSVWTVGRVMWSTPSGQTGIRFLKLRGLAQEQLREWLFINALFVCVRAEAVKERSPHSASVDSETLNSETPEDAPRVPAAAAFPFERVEVLAQADYAAILSRLAAIRREVEKSRSDLEASLQWLAEQACAFTHASGTAIALAGGDEMICRASVGSAAPPVGLRFQVNSGFSGQCIRSGVLLRCDDSETDARVDRESCRALGIRSIMAVPIRAGGGVVGLLEVFSGQPSAFGVEDRIFLQRLMDTVLFSLQRSVQALAAGNGHGQGSGATSEMESNPLGFEELDGGAVFSDNVPPETPLSGDASDIAPSLSMKWILSIAAAFVLVLAVVLFAPEIRNRFARSASLKLPAQPQVPANLPPSEHSPQAELDRLRKLAEQGDATAQFAMGAHYAVGDAVTQDYTAAARWFAQAADQGHVVAQATLGAYYWEGTGVPKDLDKAYFWSVLAQAGGDEASKYRLTGMAAQMSRGQIIAAQDEANDWLEQHQSGGETRRDSHP